MYNVLLLGGGGREHAIAWKISQSSLLDKLFIAPGNAGTALHGDNVDLSVMDFPGLIQFCSSNNIHIVIPGSEAPLVAGIVDHFTEYAPHIMVIGPTMQASQLEGSKSFAKKFMARHGIPTASYHEFTKETLDSGLETIKKQDPPVVLKADGLAAGKGVVICPDIDSASAEFKDMLSGKFGSASNRVVIEDFLDGIEFSAFVCTDGSDYCVLPVAKDYKRIGEGDIGLNTGGMGTVSPVPFVSTELWEKVVQQIIDPTIRGLQKDGLHYKGFIFFGLINVDGQPYVIEYNCRLGDPETQSILPLIETDFLALMEACGQNKLSGFDLSLSINSSATVVMSSGGYPESYEKGKTIRIAELLEDCTIFMAGVCQNNDNLETNGGRVLGVNAIGTDMASALKKAYRQIEQIDFEKKYFRKDIGFDLQ